MTEKIDCAYDKLVDVATLVPNPKNNNKHPKEQIERLAKIIAFQGQRQPIIVSNRSGFIVKGHGRLEAIKKLGWDKCAVDYQDYESEAQEYADMTADNEIAKWAEFDAEQFKEDIKEFDIDYELFGTHELIEEDQPTMEDVSEEDIEHKKVKIIFSYKDSREIIDAFLRKMSEDCPELLYQVEIND